MFVAFINCNVQAHFFKGQLYSPYQITFRARWVNLSRCTGSEHMLAQHTFKLEILLILTTNHLQL